MFIIRASLSGAGSEETLQKLYSGSPARDTDTDIPGPLIYAASIQRRPEPAVKSDPKEMNPVDFIHWQGYFPRLSNALVW